MKGKTSLFPQGIPFRSSKFSYDESISKYNDYLLNKDHPIGKSKAEFIERNLGYKRGDSKELHKAISAAIDGKIPNKVEETNYGTKESFATKIKGKNGQYCSANLVIVVQNDNGKTNWRLITITPGKKDK